VKAISLFAKRLFDFAASFVGIIVLLPLFIIIAAVIKLTSKGSVFFSQDRIGKSGHVFQILKFRTMVVDAEHLGEGLFVSSNTDTRITKIGRILRTTSLDELPQLFNVLLGSMSIVGPRPPVTYHPYNGYENYPEWAKKRFQMRPGITGLAQVRTRTMASWNDRMVIDNEYIDKFSIYLDLKIIMATVASVVLRKNVYPSDIEALKENRSANINS
jgi:lipopolysaccharide/colanic/teichoic acid biosynthesis glycosyltransferase